MGDRTLRGMRILVAEDEVMIADDLSGALAEQGAEVLGPAATVARAMAISEDEAAIDAAVLDINLRGEMIYPVADALIARGVPVVFATGYDQFIIPERFTRVPHCEKPVGIDKILGALHRGAV